MSLKQSTFKYWIRIYCYNNILILRIKRRIRSSFLSNLILLLCSPYILCNYWLTRLYEIAVGFKKVHKLMQVDSVKQFEHEIAIVSISKNEGPYLLEWIEFHRIVGVTKFYFYDNDSTDNTAELLQPYIDAGVVEYTLIEGVARQLDAYNDAIAKHKDDVRWMAFIDMDEYLVPTEPAKSISSVVDEIVTKAGGGAAGVGVNWAIFGTSHKEVSQQGLITANYFMRAENDYYLNIHIKVICNPRLVKNYISPHYPVYVRGAYTVKEAYGTRIIGWGANKIIYKNIRINHYYTKSTEDYAKKRNRGLGDREGIYADDHFGKYNRNEVLDTSAFIYAEELNIRLKNYPNINN